MGAHNTCGARRSEEVMLKAIAARPELGLYRLYTLVGEDITKEDPDVTVRMSEVRPQPI